MVFILDPGNETRLLGRKFNMLKVVSFSGRDIRGSYLWECICDCGNTTEARSYELTSGKRYSCGCYTKLRVSQTHKTHGLSRNRIYKIWTSMKHRCYDENDIGFFRYGGAGISICDEWKDNVVSFYEWAMTNGYKEGLAIDRINNKGNYEPSNCRWVTMAVQNQNQTTTKIHPDQIDDIRKDSRSHSEIARDYGVNQSTITRIKNSKTWSNIPAENISQ